MPGFGKSGTVRIIFFRLSTNNSPRSIVYVEALVTPARLDVGLIHRRDLRISRAAPQLRAELGNGICRAFDDGFNRAIWKIPDAPDYAKAVGREDRKAPIT